MVTCELLYPDLSWLSWPSCSKKVEIDNVDFGLRKGTLLHQLTYANAMRLTEKGFFRHVINGKGDTYF